ncbi:MAG TPA: hypothetical protein VEX39_07085 [Thermoleophilaceae bacterium]|nr:hypothetical protein [Thermoleophilaceae bacterium]
MTRRTHINTALALAAGTLLALPASGLAADSFGSRLLNEPANSAECDSPPCTFVSYIHPSNPNGDPYAGGAPVDGVITTFRVRAKPYFTQSPVRVTPRVADITRQNQDSATASAKASGQQVTLTANGAIEEHPTRIPVSRGQHLALDTVNAAVTYNASGDKFTYMFTPSLGQAPRTSTLPTGELLVQAGVERDRDRDGFGDETQDRCPSQAGTAGECDRTAPRVGSMKLRKGRVSFRLSEAGSVRVSVQKRRKVGKRMRYVQVKRTTIAGKQGANSQSFRRKLAKGRYRVTAVATDGNGNKSRSYAKRFRFKK